VTRNDWPVRVVHRHIGSTIRRISSAGVTLRPYSSANFLDNQLKAPPNVVTGEASARLVSHGPADDLWRSTCLPQAALAFHTFGFQDGKRQSTASQPCGGYTSSGLVGLELTAGRHSFTEPHTHPGTPRGRSHRCWRCSSLRPEHGCRPGVVAARRRALAVMLVTVLLTVVWSVRSCAAPQVWLQPAISATDCRVYLCGCQHANLGLRAHAYLHPNPDGQPVGSLRLRGYSLSPAPLSQVTVLGNPLLGRVSV